MDSEVSKYKIETYLEDTLITPELLHTLEIWAGYKGPEFYSFNTLVRDRGTIKIHGGKLCNATEIYDTNCSYVQSPRLVILAEVDRERKEPSKLDYDLFPNQVYVYNIDEAVIDEDDEENSHYPDISTYTQLPTFERLKEDLETKGTYTNYLSMIHPETGGLSYKFYAPNEFTDRINMFFVLQRSLINLNKDYLHLLGNVKENKRVSREDWLKKTYELTKEVESQKSK